MSCGRKMGAPVADRIRLDGLRAGLPTRLPGAPTRKDAEKTRMHRKPERSAETARTESTAARPTNGLTEDSGRAAGHSPDTCHDRCRSDQAWDGAGSRNRWRPDGHGRCARPRARPGTTGRGHHNRRVRNGTKTFRRRPPLSAHHRGGLDRVLRHRGVLEPMMHSWPSPWNRPLRAAKDMVPGLTGAGARPGR